MTVPPPTSARQRSRWEVWLVLGTLALHVVAGLMQWRDGDLFQVTVDALVALVMAGVLVLRIRWHTLPSVVYRCVVYVLSLRTAGDLIQHLTQGTNAGQLLYIQLLGTFSLLLAFLPTRQVAWISGGLFTVLVWVDAASGASSPLMVLATLLVFAVLRFSMMYSNAMVELRLRQEQLEVQVAHDPLTGAWTRSAVQEQGQRLMSGADRERQLLLMVDVDHFKSINDTYGHAAGDEALRQIARALKDVVQSSDMVGRWGGEEFIVLLRDVPEAFQARKTERIVEAVRALRLPDLPPLTVSVGGATLAERPDLEGVMRLADQRLYLAKDTGRDRATVPIVL